VFTIRKDPAAPVEPDFTITIPWQERSEIVQQLDALGVHRLSLFPDLDGLASYLTTAALSLRADAGISLQSLDESPI
jgi:hypothetical protein